MHDTANKKVSGALPITFPVALTCLAYLDAMLLVEIRSTAAYTYTVLLKVVLTSGLLRIRL